MLNIKNLQLENCNVLSKEYLTPELLKINPQHCLPTLVDGNFVIWDSHAIAGYLVGKYGKDDSLYPKDPEKRAMIDQRLHFDSGILYPNMYQVPLLFHYKTTVPYRKAVTVKKAYEFLEIFLEKSQWLSGNNLTIADLCCLPNITTLDLVIPVNEMEFPKLKKYIQQCSQLPHVHQINEFGIEMLISKLLDTVVKNKNIKASQKRIV